MDDQSLKLSDTDVSRAFDDPHWAKKFPPVLTVEEAAELVRVPEATIYNWSSRGLLRSCSRKVGKYLRFERNRLLKLIFNEGINNVK
jgi:excisionase family DNA binding protein